MGAGASPLLGLPAAVAAEGIDSGVVAHYGNPLGEQRLLASGTALAQVARGVVTVSGPDRLSWLDSLTSQSIARLAPGESAESLLLDPQGRVEHDIRIVDDGVTAWLILERPQTAALAAFLSRMRFMLRVEIADVSDQHAVIGSLDADLARRILGDDVIVSWQDPWRTGSIGGVSYARAAAEHPGADWTWSETVVPVGALDRLAAAVIGAEVRVAGSLAVDALRIAAWRPRLGVDTDERTIPHELDWLRSAVHLSKGCYRGQETVAKVHNLGRPPRRIVMLDLDGSEGIVVPAGAPVLALRQGEQVEAGAITSSAIHYELGPIALAVIRRAVDPDEILTVVADGASIAARQEIIVPADAGPAVTDIPRLPRLGRPA
ncbi:CAF17-like 4Fe-4S cluster assembly/insertion protein YgfZ [Naasia lichenicola]|uniref:Folate-binding protein YgfZ n=1 Tax=Naasia lichenicola TaxID=2565933 RepID=A0A4V6RZ06_9MICO|nr:folate-binding protein YgfZ [Naasia lichenicola]THG30247.1 folate-binding protein YgfZ [Naasia lichenicola]